MTSIHHNASLIHPNATLTYPHEQSIHQKIHLAFFCGPGFLAPIHSTEPLIFPNELLIHSDASLIQNTPVKEYNEF